MKLLNTVSLKRSLMLLSTLLASNYDHRRSRTGEILQEYIIEIDEKSSIEKTDIINVFKKQKKALALRISNKEGLPPTLFDLASQNLKDLEHIEVEQLAEEDLNLLFKMKDKSKIRTLIIKNPKPTIDNKKEVEYFPELIRNIDQFANLFKLEISSAKLKDENLTKKIGLLKKLKILVLKENDLVDLPFFIGGITTLKHLNLSNNQIKSIAHDFGKLQNLLYLDLSRNRLEAMPIELGLLTRLKYLDLHENRLSELFASKDKIEAWKAGFKTNFKIEHPEEELKKMKAIKTKMDKNPLNRNVGMDYTDDDCKRIYFEKYVNIDKSSALPFKSLKVLEISQNKITELSERIANIETLTQIDASHNIITDVSKKILKLRNLNFINLSQNELTFIPKFNKKKSNYKNLVIDVSGNDIPVIIPDDSKYGIADLKSLGFLQFIYSKNTRTILGNTSGLATTTEDDSRKSSIGAAQPITDSKGTASNAHLYDECNNGSDPNEICYSSVYEERIKPIVKKSETPKNITEYSSASNKPSSNKSKTESKAQENENIYEDLYAIIDESITRENESNYESVGGENYLSADES